MEDDCLEFDLHHSQQRSTYHGRSCQVLAQLDHKRSSIKSVNRRLTEAQVI